MLIILLYYFGPNTFRHYVFGASVSDFCVGAEVSQDMTL